MDLQRLDTLPAELRLFEDTAENLGKLIFQVKLFPKGHPSIENYLEKTCDSIRSMIKGRKRVIFRIVRDSLCFLNFEIPIDKINNGRLGILSNAFEKMAIGEIEFESAFIDDELLALTEIISSVIRNDRDYDLEEAWSRMSHIRIRHGSAGQDRASMLPVQVETRLPADIPVAGQQARRLKTRMGSEVENVLEHLEKIQSMEGKAAGKMILQLIENESRNNSIVLLLKSLREYDDYTFAHSVNVAVISAATARHIGFDMKTTSRIGLAAIMHDIGKVYVPKEIIHKKGKLSPAEWQIVKKHPVEGARLLREEGVEEDICRVAYEHHMRFDLKGYPMASEGEEILPASHIVRIADTYDALTTKRAYRKQISPYEAIKLMSKTRGSEFHPEYFDLFLHMMGNIPIGSMLELESGEKVLVINVGRRGGSLPSARVLFDSDGNEVEEDLIIDLDEIDLRTRKKKYVISKIEDTPLRDVEIGKYLV